MSGALYSHKNDGWTVPACNRGWENGKWMLVVKVVQIHDAHGLETGKYICKYRMTHFNPFGGVMFGSSFLLLKALQRNLLLKALMLMAAGNTFLFRVGFEMSDQQ